MQAGRNDPCPCGSGKKYKKCCEITGRVTASPDSARASRVKEADRRLTGRILRFARIRLGQNWLESALQEYIGDSDERVEDAELQLAGPWAMYGYAVTGRNITIARLFREEGASRLPLEVRDVLDAQLAGWMTIWEVQHVQRGTGVQVTDLLTGQQRFVHEVSASKTLSARDALLGMVVDSGGISFFGGIHPRPLGPRDADTLVREIRRLCHVRTRPVKTEQLREPIVQLAMIRSWRSIISQLRTRPAPKLTNTDGDPLVFITDHFDILAPDHSTLLSRITSLPGAEPEKAGPERDETVITLTKPGNARLKSWDNTIVGRVVIKGNRMRAESNSKERADALRRSLASHLGDFVRYRLRDEISQAELLRRAAEAPHRPVDEMPAADSDELAAIAKEFKEKHMLAWLDEELPALGGLTPREAAKAPRSMRSLDLLLREFENHESRLPENERLDVAALRAKLGVPI